MHSDEARRSAEGYLRLADRMLPGRLVGFYVVGSTALGAYRPGRSDLDFVAVVRGRLSPRELQRLRRVHLAAGTRSMARALARGHLEIPGTCNGVFVGDADLTRPVTEIVPLASHSGHVFAIGQGFDVNPVVWKVLAERGIPVRGAAPSTLGLRPEPDALRSWTLANLGDYWEPWATGIARAPGPARARSRWNAAWGVLGVARMHCTIATGEVVSKEAAGEYALGAFADDWRPLVEEAVAYRRRRPAPEPLPGSRERLRATAAFVHGAITDARSLTTTP